MAAVYPVENEKTIIIVSNKVKLRINLDEILLSRRGTNGVVSIKLSTDEFVVGLSKI
jgi:DNA gyrase/topoisomerase IV subunit A